MFLIIETTAFLLLIDSFFLPANSININMPKIHFQDIRHPVIVQVSIGYTEPNEHFPIYVNIFSDLSGYLKYSRAEVIVSIYLLPSTHQHVNIKGVSHRQKYSSELSQVGLKQLESKQVNIHYIPAARERLRTAILFTDCLLGLMEICWLQKRVAWEHEKFVKQADFMLAASPFCHTDRPENGSNRIRTLGKGRKVRE